MSDIQKSLIRSLQKAIKLRSGDGLLVDQVIAVNDTIMASLAEWFRQHPGVEDNTVECVVCHKTTTKTNRIVSDHWGEPKYLCGRCCDGITDAPVIHSEKARIVIEQ